MDESSEKGQAIFLQVNFTTKQEKYQIADTLFAIEADVDRDKLSDLISRVLIDNGVIDTWKDFDFTVGGEFLRGKLGDLVIRLESKTPEVKDKEDEENREEIGVERVIEIEYLERVGAPQPEDCLTHDDWVSAVDATEDLILSGSYDYTVHLWTIKGKHKQSFQVHSSEVKSVSWVPSDPSEPNIKIFCSGSHDQCVKLWKINLESNEVKGCWTGKGHERSVECVKPSPDGKMIASSSWNGHVKIWMVDEESGQKESSSNVTKLPTLTFAAHKECASAVDWSEPNELFSSSWDHTLKIWDLEMGGMKSQIAGNKAFFDVSYSKLNSTLLTASADRHIRIYDPRSNEGSIVKGMFSSHMAWVSSVNWSKSDENLFLSGSYDKLMKLWDRRISKTPLFTMAGHTERILSTTWSNPKYLISGGADNTVRVYAA